MEEFIVKKTISMLLTLCMVLSLTPTFAEDETIVKLTPLGNVNSHSQAEIINYIKSFDPSDGLVGVSEKTNGMGIPYKTTWTDDMKYAEMPSIKAPYSAGSLTKEYQETALRSLNFIRYLAGLPDDVKISDEYLSFMQQGAVILNQQFSHYPIQPGDMDDDFFKKAYKANSESNIAHGFPDLMSSITQGYAIDSSMLVPGHRNWILNMYMQYTAFGEAVRGSNMYTMDSSRKNAPDWDAICYPVSNFPTDFFDTTAAWSILISNKKVTTFDVDNIQVTLTGNGKTWSFSNQSSDNVFKIDPLTGRIYFMPTGIDGIFYSGEYTVKVTGLQTKDGNPAELEYTVNFFDIKPANFVSPKPTSTLKPTATPKPTITKKPTATPKRTATSKPTATPNRLSKYVTIIKQPSSITVTESNITEKISMEASTTVGTLTYKLGEARSADTTAGAIILPSVYTKPEHKIDDRLPVGTYYYFFNVYLGNELVATSDIATVKVVKADKFLEILPYDRIASGSLNSHEKVKGKPTVVVFGSTYSCTYPGINAGYNFIQKNSLEDKVNLLAFSSGLKKEDVQSNKFKADWFSLFYAGERQMWTLLKESWVNYPVMAYFDENGDLIRYRTSSDAIKNVEADFREMMGKSGIALPTPKPPVSSLVTIHKQPAPITMVTEGKITESISISATASSGKLTYLWAIAESDDTPPKTKVLTQKKDPMFKLGSLKEGTYYYFCILYVDGKEALRSDIATIQVVKEEETAATKQESDTNQESDNKQKTDTTKKSTTAKNPFKDVSEGSYYYKPVLWALQIGVTSGTTATTFTPNDACTRGQVVTFLWRAKGCPEPSSTSNPFADVNSNDYYYKAVLWAVEKGITSGTSATTFSPNATCTSSQVLTFLWRSNNKPVANGNSSLAKQHSGQYYTDAVAWADSTGLLSDTVANFAPNNNSPRSDIVTYLYRNAGSPDIE